jgi:hypothetical protein
MVGSVLNKAKKQCAGAFVVRFAVEIAIFEKLNDGDQPKRVTFVASGTS